VLRQYSAATNNVMVGLNSTYT